MVTHPDGLAQFVTGALPSELLLPMDKAPAVVAWLLSPLKRWEQKHFAAVCNATDVSTFVPPDYGPEPPLDEVLIPLEGRGPKDERLDVGLGPACVLQPDAVARYSLLLEGVTEGRLRDRLDFQEMEDAALPVDYWLEEGEQTFSEYVVPLFTRLQRFYQQAAAERQIVLIWYA